jgi:ElaA protein
MSKRTYHTLAFDELSLSLLYDIMALRSEVFVVEQASPYLDPDGHDQGALHVCLLQDGELVGYSRILAPGVKFAEPSVGRIVIKSSLRGTGLGRELVQYSMDALSQEYGTMPIRIEAQHHLHDFYASLGFTVASDIYDWGGIPHIKMISSPQASRVYLIEAET